HLLRNLRIAVAGQIREASLPLEREEVDELRAPWRLARACEILAPRDRVQGARLAGIRTPGKRDLAASVGWELTRLPGARDELGMRKLGHGGCADPVKNAA